MQTKTIVTSICAIFLATTAYTTIAKAGFEWVPPAPQAPHSKSPTMPAVPKKDVQVMPLGEDSDLAPIQLERAPAPSSIIEQSQDGSVRASITAPPMQPQRTPHAEMPKGKLRTSSEQKQELESEEPASLQPQKLRTADKAMEEPGKPAIPSQTTKQKSSPVSLLATNPQATMQSKTAKPAPSPQPAIANVKSSISPASQFPEVLGFGNDMPLVMALQQVVPAEYAYSFGPSVNPGARVSWNGGRPWDQVLNDMLVSLDLKATMRGKTMMITSSTTQRTASLATSTLNQKMPASGETEPQTLALDEPVQLQKNNDKKSITMSTVDRAVKEARNGSQDTGLQNEPIKAPEVKITSYKVNDTTEKPMMLKRASIQDPGEKEKRQPVTTTASADHTQTNTSRNQEIQDYVINPHPFNSTVDTSMKNWEASAGDSLRDVLEKWVQNENMQLVWDASHDFTLTSNVYVSGSLKNAVNVLVSNSLDKNQAPIIHFIQQGDQGGHSLIVKDKDHSATHTG